MDLSKLSEALRKDRQDINFGPEDSVILSSLLHPQEALKRGLNSFQSNVNTAIGVPDPRYQDEASPYAYGPTDKQRAESAFNLAGLAGAGSMPFNQSGPGTLGMFAGLRSNTAKKLNAGIARHMEQAGNSPEDVLQKTGWFRGADNLQRYEINDKNAHMKIPMSEILESKIMKPASGNYTLGDILHHPELYKAYPDLENVPFVKKPGFMDSWKTLQGWRGKDEIGLTPYSQDPLGTLLHEAQHYIQQKEGFSQGGSANSVLKEITPENLDEVAKDTIKKLSSNITDKSEIIALTDKYLNHPVAQELAKTMEQRDILWNDYYNTKNLDSFKKYNDLGKESQDMSRDLLKNLFNKEYTFQLTPTERSVIDVLERPSKHQRNINDLAELQTDMTGIQTGDLFSLKKHADTHEVYKRLAGETEARNVPDRRIMTNAQRMENPAWETQEYPYNKQFVVK